MLNNLYSKLNYLEAKDKELQSQLADKFTNELLYFDSNILDDINELTGIKAQIQLLYKLIEECKEMEESKGENEE